MTWNSDGVFEIFVLSLGEGASEPNVRLTMARQFGGPFLFNAGDCLAIVEFDSQTPCSLSAPRND